MKMWIGLTSLGLRMTRKEARKIQKHLGSAGTVPFSYTLALEEDRFVVSLAKPDAKGVASLVDYNVNGGNFDKKLQWLTKNHPKIGKWSRFGQTEAKFELIDFGPSLKTRPGLAVYIPAEEYQVPLKQPVEENSNKKFEKVLESANGRAITLADLRSMPRIDPFDLMFEKVVKDSPAGTWVAGHSKTNKNVRALVKNLRMRAVKKYGSKITPFHHEESFQLGIKGTRMWVPLEVLHSNPGQDDS